MNFLQLCQRLHMELQIDERMPGERPNSTDVTAEEDKYVLLIRYIQRAWEDIQNESPHWKWRVKQAAQVLSSGDIDYDLTAAVSDFEELIPYTDSKGLEYIFVDPNSSGNRQICTRVPYPKLVSIRDEEAWPYTGGETEASFSSGTPSLFSILPDETTITFDVQLADNTQCIFTYRKAIQSLSADSDTPESPSRHHMAIVYRAALYWLGGDEAHNMYAYFDRLHQMAMRRLKNDQLPGLRMPGF